MRVILFKGEQAKLIRMAIKKAGSERKLSNLLGFSNGALYLYKNEKTSISLDRLNTLIKYLKIDIKKIKIKNYLPDNWGRKKGGEKCVEIKKKKGTFLREMKKIRLISSKKLKQWHYNMKTNSPEEYYALQYDRFKKIGGYKYTTNKGELVRNDFERDVANILIKNNLEYEYEPLIKVGKNFYFPDFLINKNMIIECTMWRGVEKAYKLRDKIKELSKKYKVFLVIPKPLYRYYKIININHLILGLDEFASVAQTFLNK